MNIECILRRPQGTSVVLGAIQYLFSPLEDGAHVANVEETDHIDRFLAIPEAYKVYHGKCQPTQGPVAAAGLPVKAADEEIDISRVPLYGSEQHPSQFEIGTSVYTQREIVEKAFAASGLTPDEWNDLGDDERAAKMDIVLDDIADAAEQSTGQDERAALVEAYKAKFGKAPHHKKSAEAIKAELEA